jgi:phage major head subunit gpT-like protein
MQVTPANLSILFSTVETNWSLAYSLAPVVWDKIATQYPVGSEQWVSAWLTMMPKYREWLGSRVVHTPSPQTYTVPIKLFEDTMGIDKFKIEDDQFGVFGPIVLHFAMEAAKWPDYQLRDLIQNSGSWTGIFQNGLDNLTYWNTAHPVNFWDSSMGTYPNDFTGGGQTVNGINIGGALSPNAFQTVFNNMGTRKNESGESAGASPNLSMGGTQLKFGLQSLLQSQFLGMPSIGQIGTGNFPTAGQALPVNAPLVGASENMLKGLTDLLIWDDLGGSTTVGGGTYDQIFYLLTTNKIVRPFAWLLRKAPDFIPQTRPTDPNVVNTHTFQWNSEARGSAAWGFPLFGSRSGA